MEEKKIKSIKKVVKSVFEDSPEMYQSFEDRHGFFKRLTNTLLSKLDIPEGGSILDIGCGTGASSVAILGAVPESRVWGLDISPAMLETARSLAGESDRLCFVEGDAAHLSELFDKPFDAILYSASVFLIPDYMESLRQAKELLKPEGRVGLTFMDGLYDPSGKNALAVADRDAGEGVSLKKPVALAEFHRLFERSFEEVTAWTEDMLLPTEVLREFFSVPAMSSGLFPGLEYTERVEKVSRLFLHLPKTHNVFRWILMVGKAGRG
ncbi:class I SAM-dependent methyltransferase [Thermodesulfobacteriota bacterium]